METAISSPAEHQAPATRQASKHPNNFLQGIMSAQVKDLWVNGIQ
jgi:hypothetical protein